MFRPTKGLLVPLLSFLTVLLPAVLMAQDIIPRGTVLITHLSPDYGSASDEFVVLYNAGSDTVDLAGHEVRYFTASGSPGSAGFAFGDPTPLPPGRHFLLASRDTVSVGSARALRDAPFTSGMATTGGQLLFRRLEGPDSVLFAAAWGTLAGFVADMTDAASWGGDGMLSLVWQDSMYVRASYNGSNLQFQHTPATSITAIPSLHPYVPPPPLVAWHMAFTIRQGTSVDTSLMTGMDSAASDGFDTLFDLPAPPAPAGGTLYAGFFRSDLGLATGPYLLRDMRMLRSLSDISTRWVIDLFPVEVGTPLAITVQITNVPLGLPVMVRDMQSGLATSRLGDSLVYSFIPETTAPLQFELWVGDSTAPDIHFNAPTTGDVFVVASTIEISIEIADGSGIDSSLMRLEDLNTSLMLVTSSGIDTQSVFTSQLPRRLISDSVRFVIDAFDRMGNHTTQSSPAFSIVPDTVRRTFGAGWHLMSTPIDPLVPTWSSITGAARSDSVFAFDYSMSGGYRPADSLVPGRGYFLGSMSDRRLSIFGRPSADTVLLPLDPGFALVSNSGPKAVALSDLAFVYDGTIQPYAGAVGDGIIGNGLFGFNPNTNSYVLSDSLQPWQAYWIPIMGSGVVVRIDNHSAVGEFRTLFAQGDGWRLRFFFESAGRVDSFLVIGANPSATSGFDATFDMPAPPPPPRFDGLRTVINRPEWELATGPYVLCDIQASGSGHAWELLIHSDRSADVRIYWRVESGTLPDDLRLTDVTTGEHVWFTSTDEFRATVIGDRWMRIHAGATEVRDDGPLPDRFAVSRNFPNPFNPSTEIAVDIPAPGTVTVLIFDLVGRRVGSVADGPVSAGRHTFTWTSELPSGVYYYQVAYYREGRAREVRTGKATLVK